MGTPTRFRNLDVYQDALDLVRDIYNLNLPLPEKYTLVSQIKRAGISIPLNIAESQGRRTQKDQKQFLIIARGSAYEILSIIDILNKINLIPVKQYQKMEKQLLKIVYQLNGLIRYLHKPQTTNHKPQTTNHKPQTFRS